MEKTITGYQYGDGNVYIGPYEFPDNLDKTKIHLPPRTTLKAPPENIEPGFQAVFDPSRGDWSLVEKVDPIAALQAQAVLRLQEAEAEAAAAEAEAAAVAAAEAAAQAEAQTPESAQDVGQN